MNAPMISRFTKRVLAALTAGSLLFASCRPDEAIVTNAPKLVKDYDNRVAWQWNELWLEIERYAEVYRPCPAARALGYIGLATYEASVPAMPEYQSIALRYNGLNIPAFDASAGEYHWPTVINAVYATMYKHFFANVTVNDLFKIASLEASFNNQFSTQVSPEVFRRSRNWGITVADAVWTYSATDTEGHDKYLNPRPTTYTPPTGAGKWQPTPPGNQGAMFPYWGRVRTFAIKETEKLSRPPLPFSEDRNSPFYAQALEVYALTTPQSTENRWIAEFWSDDELDFTFSPPSRWLAIGNQAIELTKSSLETTVIMVAKVGMALNDASVACWHSKYVYNIERPVTYIQRNINPTWNVVNLTTNGFLRSTPSFPAYPSGHSTFGAAAAEALSSVFGYNFSMTDRCHDDRTDFQGRSRSYTSFYEMAQENAFSRLPLGVHYRMDAEEGLRLGYLAGRRVNALPFKK